MKTKQRTYNPRLARKGQTYTVQEVAALYGKGKNTVLLWIKAGLATIDGQKPYLIHGSDLQEYLKKKRAGKKKTCRPDEFYCCKCRVPRKAWENVADVLIRNEAKLSLSALCAVCNTPVYRAGSVKKLPEYRKIFSIQTIREEHIEDRPSPLVNRDMRKDETA